MSRSGAIRECAMIPGWKDEMESEYMVFLQKAGVASPREFAAGLGISECCAVYWLTEMAREGRIRILGVELVKDGEMPCEEASFLACERKGTCPVLREPGARAQPV
jgi:hypothetical protein